MSGWQLAVADQEIEYDPEIEDLLIKSCSKLGNKDRINIDLINDAGTIVGEFYLEFRYGILRFRHHLHDEAYHTRSFYPDMSHLGQGYNTFKISLMWQSQHLRLKVFCNAHEAANSLIRSSDCSDSIENWYWIKNVTKIKIHHDNTPSDYTQFYKIQPGK